MSLLEPSRDYTAFFDTKTKILGLKRSYRRVFQFAVLFLHLTFLKTWFDGVQRFQQRRP